jgi:hypothetical protein
MRLICCRRPLSNRSTHAVSPPIQIPRISINCGDDEDVFDETTKENLAPFQPGRQVLFPSIGTSPRHAMVIKSPLFKFNVQRSEDYRIKKLGKGGFGTVVLGSLKGIFYNR